MSNLETNADNGPYCSEPQENETSYAAPKNYYLTTSPVSPLTKSDYVDFPVESVNNFQRTPITDRNNNNYAPDDHNTIRDGGSISDLKVSTTTSNVLKISNSSLLEEYYFNERFQSLISQYDAFSSNDETVTLLSDCNSDFTYAVETFGKIIISEKNLPDEKKTIKPINLGGVAGGEKFIHRGILFKYAIDPVVGNKNGSPFYLYGGDQRNDELAMKAAGNELKALHRFVAACLHVKELHTPLMSLCDFYGVRLIAMSLLPITDLTLIYGSSDAGTTVHNSNPTFHKNIQTVSEMLNLKPHYVNDTKLFTAGDVEGHEGNDGRLYVVDFGRLYPPEAPNIVANAGGRISNTRSVFYQHLRPEFVKMNAVPLCSDAFTSWQKTDPQKAVHNQEVAEATERLVHQVIPKCAEDLDALELVRAETMSSITEQVHRRGINLRHMGLIRQYCKHPAMRLTLLTEMWARCMKTVIYRILRLSSFQQRLLSSIQARRIISQIINLVLCPGPFNTWYWREHSAKCSKEEMKHTPFEFVEEIPSFKWSLAEKYGTKALSTEESNASVLPLVMIKVGLTRLSKICCFEVSPKLIDASSKAQQVTEVDIVSVEPRIKYTSVIHLCDGLSSLKKGLSLPASDKQPFLRVLLDAESHLSRAWSLHPESETIAYNRAIVSFHIAKIYLSPEWTESNLTNENIADAIVWMEAAGNCFEDAYSMLQDVSKYIPKSDPNHEAKKEKFERMQFDCLVHIAKARLECAIYESRLYKALNPYSISIFEQAAKWFLEVQKRDTKTVDQLIQDSFIHFTSTWTVGVLFLCTINLEFKSLIASNIKNYSAQITEISFGKGVIFAPHLVTSTQVDIVLEMLGTFPIKTLDLSHCVCLNEKSVVEFLQHYGKMITTLRISGIQVSESLMGAIGANGTSLQSLVMKKCNLTNEVLQTWIPSFWNRIGKNSAVPVKLEELDLEGNPQLHDTAITALLKKLPNLKKLNLKSCNMTEEAIQDIKKTYYSLELLHTTGDVGISHPLALATGRH